MSKLNINDLTREFAKTSIQENTPSSGAQTIYSAFADPSVEGNLDKVAIKRIIILPDIPSVGEVDISITWAVSAANQKDQLLFNKRWRDKEIYNYKVLNF